jgi:hypothetical protein
LKTCPDYVCCRDALRAGKLCAGLVQIGWADVVCCVLCAGQVQIGWADVVCLHQLLCTGPTCTVSGRWSSHPPP